MRAEDENYLVDHSTFSYLWMPEDAVSSTSFAAIGPAKPVPTSRVLVDNQ